MKTIQQEQKPRILEAAQKLQNMPIFKPHKVHGLILDWNKGTTRSDTSIRSVKEQKRDYILRWTAEPCYVSMDSPKRSFFKGLEWMRKVFTKDQDVLEALKVVERFI